MESRICKIFLFVAVVQSLCVNLCVANNWEFPLDDEDGAKFLLRRSTHDDALLSRSRRWSSPRLNLSESYEREVPPPHDDGPVPVRFTVLIYSVRGINEIEQEITIEMRLQIFWNDTRLEAWKSQIPEGKNYITLTSDIGAKLWHPDIFVDFVKGIVQPELLKAQPVSLRYYDSGNVRVSTRVTIRMACPMAFYYYPVDKQECHVDMKSYAHSNDVLNLNWKLGENILSLLQPGMDLPNFGLGLENPKAPLITTNSGNVYSSIRFTVLLKRKLSYHFIQTYIPSALFVVISWLSFLVPPESIPGRMAICMTTLLSQTTMFSGIRQSIPKVSYPKALDIWMVACIFFVFLTLVEYTLVLKLRSLIPKEQARQERKASDVSQLKEEKASSNCGGGQCLPILYNKYADYVKTCEKYTWMVVISLFAIFNLVYWPWMLTKSGYYAKFGEDLFYKGGETIVDQMTAQP